MTFLRSLLPSREGRSLSFQQVFGSGGDWAGTSTSAGSKVTEESSLRLTTVYSCVSLISEVTAALPWDAVSTSGPVRQPSTSPRWMIRPNVDQLPTDFKQRVLTSLLLWGNAYCFKVFDSQGRLVELWPLHPADVQWDGDAKRWVYGGQPVGGHEILHIPGLGVPGSKLGLSPIGQAREAVGLALSAEEFGARFFGSGANPGGVLEVAGHLTQEQTDQLSAQWEKTHGGVNRSRKPAVLSGGVTWKPISVPPNDAQFLETRKFQRAEICGLYRVPPHMIGDVDRSTSWGSGIEQQNIGFVIYTLGPWIARLEESFSTLMQPEAKRVKVNVNGLLRGDAQARAGYFKTMREIGALNVDEIRAKEDMPPIEGGAGQTFMQPLNFGPLGGVQEGNGDDDV